MTAPRTTPAARKPAARKPAPRKPQDRLPKAQPTGADHPYDFTGPDGKRYTIPAVIDIFDGAFIRQNRNDTALGQMFTLLEAVFDEGDPALAAVDSMKTTQLDEFFQGFMKHIGIDLGESQASATS